MSVRDDERAESDIRRRAAWLLVMLAVVAGLFVVLSVTLFKTSGHRDQGQVDDVPTIGTSAPPSSGRADSPATSPPPAGASTSGATIGTPSCPGTDSCAVDGDVGGAMSAINAYRSEHGKQAVPTTSSAAAAKCALSKGDDCPSGFVWVRVADLSGSGVVDGVTGFNSAADLLDDAARSFEVGWAYDPASKNLSCALIRTG